MQVVTVIKVSELKCPIRANICPNQSDTLIRTLIHYHNLSSILNVHVSVDWLQ